MHPATIEFDGMTLAHLPEDQWEGHEQTDAQDGETWRITVDGVARSYPTGDPEGGEVLAAVLLGHVSKNLDIPPLYWLPEPNERYTRYRVVHFTVGSHAISVETFIPAS